MVRERILEFFKGARKHSPAILGVIMIVLDSLAQAAYIRPSASVAILLNGLLAAAGLGVIHFRTINQ